MTPANKQTNKTNIITFQSRYILTHRGPIYFEQISDLSVPTVFAFAREGVFEEGLSIMVFIYTESWK
jgi:hypothetical protein